MLAPTLRPGDIVVMDNSLAQKRRGPSRHRAAGARLLYLPPYSPDLNPIEQAFSKLKTLIRKAEERTVDGLWRRASAVCSKLSRPENAPTTSATPDMRLLKSEKL